MTTYSYPAKQNPHAAPVQHAVRHSELSPNSATDLSPQPQPQPSPNHFPVSISSAFAAPIRAPIRASIRAPNCGTDLHTRAHNACTHACTHTDPISQAIANAHRSPLAFAVFTTDSQRLAYRHPKPTALACAVDATANPVAVTAAFWGSVRTSFPRSLVSAIRSTVPNAHGTPIAQHAAVSRAFTRAFEFALAGSIADPFGRTIGPTNHEAFARPDAGALARPHAADVHDHEHP